MAAGYAAMVGSARQKIADRVSSVPDRLLLSRIPVIM
jgi:hypothetical protein